MKALDKRRVDMETQYEKYIAEGMSPGEAAAAVYMGRLVIRKESK